MKYKYPRCQCTKQQDIRYQSHNRCVSDSDILRVHISQANAEPFPDILDNQKSDSHHAIDENSHVDKQRTSVAKDLHDDSKRIRNIIGPEEYPGKSNGNKTAECP